LNGFRRVWLICKCGIDEEVKEDKEIFFPGRNFILEGSTDECQVVHEFTLIWMIIEVKQVSLISKDKSPLVVMYI
jgi:hypothetical protein